MRRRSFASKGRSRSDGEADRKGPRVAICCSSEFVPSVSMFLRVCFPQRFQPVFRLQNRLFLAPKTPLPHAV